MEKIYLHSITDLITNLSTTIYTYSDNSLDALKELVNEFFSSLGVDKKCSDVFHLTVMMDDNYAYRDYISENENEDVPEELYKKYKAADYKGQVDIINALITDVASGKIAGNEWFVEMDERLRNKENYNCYRPSSVLYVSAKEPQFENLAKLLVKFLYSTNHDGGYDG